CDGVGYPDEAIIWVCASDGNAGNPGPGSAPSISEYGRGFAATSKRPLGAYGNRVAVDAFRSGAGLKCVGTWVPSTWNADANKDVLIQEANWPQPIDGTDINSIHGDWPRWGSTGTPSVPKEDDEMWSAIIIG